MRGICSCFVETLAFQRPFSPLCDGSCAPVTHLVKRPGLLFNLDWCVSLGNFRIHVLNHGSWSRPTATVTPRAACSRPQGGGHHLRALGSPSHWVPWNAALEATMSLVGHSLSSASFLSTGAPLTARKTTLGWLV